MDKLGSRTEEQQEHPGRLLPLLKRGPTQTGHPRILLHAQEEPVAGLVGGACLEPGRFVAGRLQFSLLPHGAVVFLQVSPVVHQEAFFTIVLLSFPLKGNEQSAPCHQFPT